ncbi:nucleoside diphosphate kinase 6 isoform X4 [Oncorhynchus mykiss]|nr:nucleoside diphosphate kinase 6 isoform X4 [Oncorhynchus mykiss]
MLITTRRCAKALQLTLAVIKPDAVAHPVILEALHQRILENNFIIVRSKDLVWRRQDSEKFYSEHAGRFFYQRLVEFMSRFGGVGAEGDQFLLPRLQSGDVDGERGAEAQEGTHGGQPEETDTHVTSSQLTADLSTHLNKYLTGPGACVHKISQ